MMDRQKTYDTVKAHLLKQNKKSQRGDEVSLCLYRSSDGLKCAIGCLIPDELYFESMESMGTVQGLCLLGAPNISKLGKLRTLLGIETENDIDFLGRLQQVHDGFDPGLWKERLEVLAENEGLVP